MKKNLYLSVICMCLASCSFMEPKDVPVRKTEIALPEATAYAFREHLTSSVTTLKQVVAERPDSFDDFQSLTEDAGYTFLIRPDMSLIKNIQQAWYRLEFGLQVIENPSFEREAPTPYQAESKASYLAEKTRYLYWKALSADRLQGRVYDLLYILKNDIKNAKNKELRNKLKDYRKRVLALSVKLLDTKEEFYSFLNLNEAAYKFRSLGQEKFALPFAPQNAVGYEIKALNDREELYPYDFEPQVERVALLKEVEKLTPLLKHRETKQQNFATYAQSWMEISDFLSTESYNPALFQPGHETFRKNLIGMDILNQFHLSWALYNLTLQNYRVLSHQLQSAQQQLPILKCSALNVDPKILEQHILFLEKSMDTHFAYADVQYALGLLLKSISGLNAVDHQTTLVELKTRMKSLDFGDFSDENAVIPPPLARLKPPIPTFIALKPVHPVANAEFELVVPRDLFWSAALNQDATFTSTLDDGSPLPDWIQFDPKTLTFTGVAPQEEKSYKFMILGEDSVGQKTFTVIDMIIDTEAVEIMTLYGREHKPTVVIMRDCPMGLCEAYPFEKDYQEAPVYIKTSK